MTPKCEEYKRLVDDYVPDVAGPDKANGCIDDLVKLWNSLAPREQNYLAAYYECISDGCTPKLADMLASQQPPGGMTDSTFLEGHCNGNQFEKRPEFGDHYKKIAEQAGVSVKGKVYKGGLARFPGDPEAWVGGRADVERVCRQRGWGCEGAVSVAPTEAGRLPGKKAGNFAKRLHDAGLPVGGD